VNASIEGVNLESDNIHMVFQYGNDETRDARMLALGAVHLFMQMDIYEEALAEFCDLGYLTIKLKFETVSKFESDLSAALKWEDQFGYSPWNGNLNALNDGFRGEPFESSDSTAICIENFDALVSSNSTLSFHLLDMIERHSRNYLLYGKKLIALIQTNEPKYSCDKIGAGSTHWNEKEWLNKNRGL